MRGSVIRQRTIQVGRRNFFLLNFDRRRRTLTRFRRAVRKRFFRNGYDAVLPDGQIFAARQCVFIGKLVIPRPIDEIRRCVRNSEISQAHGHFLIVAERQDLRCATQRSFDRRKLVLRIAVLPERVPVFRGQNKLALCDKDGDHVLGCSSCNLIVRSR